MELEERWNTDEGQDWTTPLEPIEQVRTWEQAKAHLVKEGVSEEEIEQLNRADLPERQVASHIASSKGFTYPNYRPL